MPSLGSMNDNELLPNMVAVAVLVITVTANVAIHIIELQRYQQKAIIPSIMMLLSLVMLVSMALSVSTMKRSLKWKYQEKHREALEEEEEEEEEMKMDDQRRRMMKYWVMAESSCPQFVVARSNVSAASSLISSLFYCIYTLVQVLRGARTNAAGKSLYGISTKWIVHIQSIGLGIAVIVAALRWFVAAVFTCTTTFSDTFKIESYWIQTLNDWRNSLLAGFKIGPNKWGKHLLDAQWCVLTFCIGVQCCVVLVSKTLVFFSGFMVTPFASCFSHMISKFARRDDGASSDTNLSRYVLLLDGEAELPESLVRSMCGEADRMIQIGREKKPSNLISLLRNINVGSSNNQITSLVSDQDCWTLQVVTLTSIAVALPNISEHQRKQLLSSVSQGLCLAKIVEKTLDTNAELKSIRKAASVTWVEVLVYSKWVEIDLRRAFLQCRNGEEVVQELSDKA
ncbi:uncharacterized protein LOC130986547 [Salvia miltiorrhiza]|uniref:uncharacterized protein LOC130986547 n=1 Tax=Salvia miltiorrhiza TaxID=226208 RepID=UPI0025ABB1FC|nr:uncharacterized protein LOC130986547 [Salvia miltiorrhiza]